MSLYIEELQKLHSIRFEITYIGRDGLHSNYGQPETLAGGYEDSIIIIVQERFHIGRRIMTNLMLERYVIVLSP